MPYPEIMIRQCVRIDADWRRQKEKQSEAVDATLQNSKGTVMVIVNSVCGLCGRKARQGLPWRCKRRSQTNQLPSLRWRYRGH